MRRRALPAPMVVALLALLGVMFLAAVTMLVLLVRAVVEGDVGMFGGAVLAGLATLVLRTVTGLYAERCDRHLSDMFD